MVIANESSQLLSVIIVQLRRLLTELYQLKNSESILKWRSRFACPLIRENQTTKKPSDEVWRICERMITIVHLNYINNLLSGMLEY
jgi:hypothetical protein